MAADGGSSGTGGISASGRARSRSPSRQPSRSPSRSPSRQRRTSMTLHPNIGLIAKRRLCIEGFFYANQYEGPYGKHIAVITHAGTVTFCIGAVLAIISFTVFAHTPSLDPMKVTSIVVLIIGVGISVSTTTVYTRAHNNGRSGTLGRLNLNSQDILLKIALSFTIFMVLAGVVIVPISFSMPDISIFTDLKYVGICFIIVGVIGVVLMLVCGKFWTRKLTSRSRSTTQQSRRPSRLPRSRANSAVVPEIRVEEHQSDTGSDFGTGSDITEAFSRRASLTTPSYVITSPAAVPPPYCVRDPHPGAGTDAGSSVLAVSATHSMVTLLQYAYADELDIPPPPYSEAEQFPTVSVTAVRELNDEPLRAEGAAQETRGEPAAEGHRAEQLNSPSTTSIGLNSSISSQNRPNARSLSSMLMGIQTESSSLTIPDT